jgi:hypothetical protein
MTSNLNPQLIKTNILDKQHELLHVDFGQEWLTYLQEQAKTKQGENKSTLLAGECSYQPEWLDQKEWIKYLCDKYIKTFKSKLFIATPDIDIFANWLVYHKGDDFNPIHNHSGDISGVFYLDCPKDVINKEWQQGQSKEAGLDILYNDGSIFHVRPVPGTGVLFPSLTNHCAYPYKSKLDITRLSSSFNAKII